MKIAIDARLYGLEHAGIGRYVMNLVNHLVEIDKENEYHILLRKDYYEMLGLPKNWTKYLVNVRHYTVREQVVLPKILNKIDPDITHFPHFNIPIRYKKPYVVTIHDLSKHRSKSKDTSTLPYYAFLLKRITYYRVIKTAILNSKSIVVPSKAVKEDIIQHYNSDISKIRVIYEGVDTFSKKQKDSFDIGQNYGLDRPYFIFTGNAYPHKNLPRLIEAMVLLNEQEGEKCMLGISSSRSVFTVRLQEMISKIKAEKYVKILGFVPDEELYSLYKNATAFVYPSLMEGFGLPGLEAMQAGTPALVSDIPVFREIYKDKAMYFNPFDYTAIADSMKSALNLSKEKRNKLINEGKKHVEKFNWGKMAKETLEVYENSASL